MYLYMCMYPHVYVYVGKKKKSKSANRVLFFFGDGWEQLHIYSRHLDTLWSMYTEYLHVCTLCHTHTHTHKKEKEKKRPATTRTKQESDRIGLDWVLRDGSPCGDYCTQNITTYLTN